MRDVEVTQQAEVVPESTLGDSSDGPYFLVLNSPQVLVRKSQFIAVRMSNGDSVAVWILGVVNRLLRIDD
jgi:hypothetical protein